MSLNAKIFELVTIVLVERSGDVIPQVVKSIKEKRTGAEKSKSIPKKCPVCQTEVIRPKVKLQFVVLTNVALLV